MINATIPNSTVPDQQNVPNVVVPHDVHLPSEIDETHEPLFDIKMSGGISFPKHFKPKVVFGALAAVFLVIGTGAAAFLSTQQQDLRQQASTGTDYAVCAGGVTEGKDACDTGVSYVTCHDGQFGESHHCNGTDVCRGGSCKAISEVVEITCAGGKKPNEQSCDTGVSYKVCGANGQFGESHHCPGTQICRSDSCGDGPTVTCGGNTAVNASSCNTGTSYVTCQSNGQFDGGHSCLPGWTCSGGKCESGTTPTPRAEVKEEPKPVVQRPSPTPTLRPAVVEEPQPVVQRPTTPPVAPSQVGAIGAAVGIANTNTTTTLVGPTVPPTTEVSNPLGGLSGILAGAAVANSITQTTQATGVAQVGAGVVNIVNILLSRGVTVLNNGQSVTPNTVQQFGPQPVSPDYVRPNIYDLAAILAANNIETRDVIVAKATQDNSVSLALVRANQKGSVKEQKINQITEAVKAGKQVIAAATIPLANGKSLETFITISGVNAEGDLLGKDTALNSDGTPNTTDKAQIVNYTKMRTTLNAASLIR